MNIFGVVVLPQNVIKVLTWHPNGHGLKQVLVDNVTETMKGATGWRVYECRCGAQYVGRSAKERGHGPIEDCPVFKREVEIRKALLEYV